MKLLVLILKKISLLDNIIDNLAKNNITRGTIIDANGMAGTLAQRQDMPFLSMLKMTLLEETGEDCKVMLLVLDEKDIPAAKKAIKSSIGDINAPNSGIMFTLPVLDVEGIN